MHFCRVDCKIIAANVLNLNYSVSFWRVVEVRTFAHEEANYVEARDGMDAVS